VNIRSDKDQAFWSRAEEILGCGPTLVRNGEIAVYPESEEFQDPKILTMACGRSAVGITQSGHLIMITCGGATITQLAEIMLELGCSDAMNLDGGASSSLIYDGRYLTAPGRNISNALLVIPK
jgi:exopolysaccharide biosynthesis protein